MCDCEDFVSAQELKGTSLPSPAVDSWDKEDKKQRAEFVRNEKKTKTKMYGFHFRGLCFSKLSHDPFCVSPTRCFTTVLAKEK